MRLRALFVCACLSIAPVARAQNVEAWAVLSASKASLRVDGDVSEWRGARFQRIGQGSGAAADVALAYDATGLYVAARVRDEAFVRSGKPNRSEDALVVSLGFPLRGELSVSELWLFAGRIGESAASAQLRSGTRTDLVPLPKAKIIEGPNAESPQGYVVEAYVPWSSFEGGSDWQYARGSVRLHDVDARGGGARDYPELDPPLTAAKLPWLSIEGGPVLAVYDFLRAKNLDAALSKVAYVGDVRGDAHAERVLVVGTLVVVSGAGTEYNFTELPVRAAPDVLQAELRDLTGDGRPELALRLRQQNELGVRELFAVYGFAGAAPAAIFTAELRKETKDGVASAELRYERGKSGPMQFTVSTGTVKGLTPENYREAPSSGEVGIPLPWGPWRERVYGWNGTRFEVVREKANPTAKSIAPASTVSASNAVAEEPARAVVEGTPLDAYRRARGVSPTVPARYAQAANVLGDTRAESVAVFGRDLVVSGDSLAGSGGFFFIGLPVADANDVLGVQTSDLTGDGRREVLVRVRQRIGDVQRELMYCYSVAAQRAEQLLVVEVARARGVQRIDNRVAVIADKQRSVLTIEPGEARGWSAGDYPFVVESRDGVAPLLLPWKDHTTQYIFERDRLVPKVRTSN